MLHAMPKANDTWTVLPHRPLEKLEPNLWRVEGDLPKNRGTRVMTIVKLASGGLVIHNAVALEEDAMKEIEAFGTPEILIVPNGFHRLDAKVFKDRYPKVRVLCPASAKKKVEQVVPVDGSFDDGPKDDGLHMFHLDGAKQHEGVLEVKSPAVGAARVSLVLREGQEGVPRGHGEARRDARLEARDRVARPRARSAGRAAAHRARSRLGLRFAEVLVLLAGAARGELGRVGIERSEALVDAGLWLTAPPRRLAQRLGLVRRVHPVPRE